jgi:hypothetical protein
MMQNLLLKIVKEFGLLKNMKYISFLILLFPGSVVAGDYTAAVNKIGEVLYNNSQAKKDIDEGFKELKYKTPDNIRKPMEIILPTVMSLIEHKFELKYVKEF